MTNYLTWILFLILPHVLVVSRPLDVQYDSPNSDKESLDYEKSMQSEFNNFPSKNNFPFRKDQIISVRITSSVAVDRGRGKLSQVTSENRPEQSNQNFAPPPTVTEMSESTITVDDTNEPDVNVFLTTTITPVTLSNSENVHVDVPPNLIGANFEYLKQLNAKKNIENINKYEQLNNFHVDIDHSQNIEEQDSVAESSVKSVIQLRGNMRDVIPQGRSISFSSNSKNYIREHPDRRISSEYNGTRLSAINFHVVHDEPQNSKFNRDNTNPSQSQVNLKQFYGHLPKLYSEPAKIYGEPAKYYSEPAKVYSEPAKLYSEPAKIYSEPAKIYSEPAKFYSQPASLFLPPQQSPWKQTSQNFRHSFSTTPITTLSVTPASYITSTPRLIASYNNNMREQNYEVDEKISVMTNGKAHGVQVPTTMSSKQDNPKVGYVVEGNNFKKYIVEERTSDGFIVGEYGVVRNEDGALRGVRYTADSEVNPSLIHDGLMKFLQLTK